MQPQKHIRFVTTGKKQIDRLKLMAANRGDPYERMYAQLFMASASIACGIGTENASTLYVSDGIPVYEVFHDGILFNYYFENNSLIINYFEFYPGPDKGPSAAQMSAPDVEPYNKICAYSRKSVLKSANTGNLRRLRIPAEIKEDHEVEIETGRTGKQKFARTRPHVNVGTIGHVIRETPVCRPVTTVIISGPCDAAACADVVDEMAADGGRISDAQWIERPAVAFTLQYLAALFKVVLLHFSYRNQTRILADARLEELVRLNVAALEEPARKLLATDDRNAIRDEYRAFIKGGEAPFFSGERLPFDRWTAGLIDDVPVPEWDDAVMPRDERGVLLDAVIYQHTQTTVTQRPLDAR